MPKKDILIQLIGILGTVFYFASFQFKKNKTLYRIQLISYFLYSSHMFLLGAYTGSLSYILNGFRSFCLSSNKKFLNSNIMCIIICLLQGGVLYFTFDGWTSVLPIVANIAATYAGYTRNSLKIRSFAMFINSPLWMIYDVSVGSWAGILDEVFSEISVISSVIRHGWKNLNKTE